METITIVMFLLAFALTVFFTLFAILTKEVVWDLTAMVLWGALGLINIGLAADPIFYDLSMFYYVLCMIFMILAFKDTYLSMVRRRREEEEEQQWTVE